MSSYALRGTPRVIGLNLRRDRLFLPLWVLSIIALAAGFAPALPEFAGNAAETAVMQETMKSPAMVAMCGKIYGSVYTYGVMLAQLILMWVLLMTAVMNILLVTRHTRRDEEDGRTEILLSLPVGRAAPAFAIFMEALALNALIGLFTAFSLVALKVDSIDFAGSMLYGATLGAVGFVFAGISLLFGQLSRSSKGQNGFSLAILGIAYLTRAAADTSSEAWAETAARISPLGLAERGEIYVNNYLWPVLVLLLEGIVLFAVAIALCAGRDYGAGLLPERRGRRNASPLLASANGLFLRQLRGTFAVWAIVIFVFSASYGTVFGDMKNFYETNDLFKAFLSAPGASTAGMMDQIITMLVMVMTMIALIPSILAVLKLSSEEKRGRMEQVLAKPVSRVRLSIFILMTAIAVAVVMQLLIALGMYSAASQSMADPPDLGRVILIALSQLPVCVIFVGAGAFFGGALPKAAGLVWGYLGLSFMLSYLGGILNLPGWARSISPFELLPKWPVETYEPPIAIAMGAAGLVLAILGMYFYRRRDAV